MRTCIALALVAWMTAAMASAATAADSDTPAGKDNEVTQLKAELRAMRAQMGLMQQRLDALSARVGSAAPAAGSASGQGVASGGASGVPPGITPAGVPLGAQTPPGETMQSAGAGGITPGAAIKSLMPGAMSGATAKPPGFAMSSAPQGQGVIIPSIQGVPQTFIPDIGGVG